MINIMKRFVERQAKVVACYTCICKFTNIHHDYDYVNICVQVVVYQKIQRIVQ